MILGFFKISGHSMEPTIKNGQVVVVSDILFMFKPPEEGNIVAFKNKGKVYLSGDNRLDSLDSRRFGWIEGKDIIGKTLCIIG